MPSVVTIGVYGFDADSFLRRLRAANVGLLLDVRQRRGVRGPEYAWANSLRLQAMLAAARIAYEHHPELAPTTELRQLQYAEDKRQGVGKRSRNELAYGLPRGIRTDLDVTLSKITDTEMFVVAGPVRAAPEALGGCAPASFVGLAKRVACG